MEYERFSLLSSFRKVPQKTQSSKKKCKKLFFAPFSDVNRNLFLPLTFLSSEMMIMMMLCYT